MYEGLKEYLEKKGLTQPRMAEMLGVSLPYVNAVLLGKKTLGKKNAKKWANLFGLSEHFLLTGVGSPGNDTKEQTTSQIGADNLLDSRDESGIDQSSLVNALLAAKDETIATLREQLQQQQEIIQLLKRKLSDLEVETGYHGFSRDIKASEPEPKEIRI